MTGEGPKRRALRTVGQLLEHGIDALEHLAAQLGRVAVFLDLLHVHHQQHPLLAQGQKDLFHHFHRTPCELRPCVSLPFPLALLAFFLAFVGEFGIRGLNSVRRILPGASTESGTPTGQ